MLLTAPPKVAVSVVQRHPSMTPAVHQAHEGRDSALYQHPDVNGRELAKIIAGLDGRPCPRDEIGK